MTLALQARVEAMRNQVLITTDGKIYDHLGTQLKYFPSVYSTRLIWKSVKGSRSGPEVERIRKYMTAPLFKHPPLYAYLISVSKRIFGNSRNSSRYVTVFFGLATIVVVFCLGKVLWGAYWGLLAAFLTAIDPVSMFCSQKIWIESTETFFIYSGLLLLFMAGRGRRVYSLSAVFMGLALLCKYSAILVMVPVYAVLIFSRYIKDRKALLLYFTVPFLVFSPWIIWNFKVYGWSFASLILTGFSVLAPGKLFMLSTFIVVATSVVVLLAVIRCFFAERIRAFCAIRLSLPDTDVLLKWLRIAASTAVIAVLCISAADIFRGFSWKYLAPTGASRHMLKNESAHFFFSHLMELSPLFVFSYISVFFTRRWKTENTILFLIPVVSFVFLGVVGGYESRYAAIATPAMMLLGCYGIRELFASCSGITGLRKYVIMSLLASVIVIAVSKTLYYDLIVVIKNDFIYF